MKKTWHFRAFRFLIASQSLHMPRKLFKYLCFVILSMFLLAGLKAIISRPFTTPPSPTAVMAVKDMVESLITDNLVVVFSKSFCPFCIKAKKLLESLNIAFKPVELDIVEDGPAIQSYLATKVTPIFY